MPKRRPNVNLIVPGRDVDFQAKRVAATKEARRRVRASDVKIKFLLPAVKDVEVKRRGNVIRKMKVRRVAKHVAKSSSAKSDNVRVIIL